MTFIKLIDWSMDRDTFSYEVANCAALPGRLLVIFLIQISVRLTEHTLTIESYLKVKWG